MIPYGRQEINSEDINSVIGILKSDFLTQGPTVSLFEEKFAAEVGASYAVAVNSGTSALHMSCAALGLGKGGLLWTSPISFVASANCALYCGADVDFVDIDLNTYNMSVDALANKLERAEKKGRLPDIVVPVHMCGRSCDVKSIKKLADEYHFKIIEDACHAIGGEYRGKPIGNCQYSDISVFSFHPVKIITTAEGGMATTNDAEIFENMRLFRNHGITRDEKQMTKEPDGPWYYQQIGLGYNYRMTDVQAALGISQLERLKDYVKKRNDIADLYDELLDGLPVVTPSRIEDGVSSFHLYVILIKNDLGSPSRREIFDCLRENGIGVNVHYIPIYKQPYYENMGYEQDDFPISENYYSSCISLPIFPTLDENDQRYVVEMLKQVVHK